MTVRAYPHRRVIPVLLLAMTFTLTAGVGAAFAVCGDGVLEAGEQCDDTSGCCSVECTYAPKGTTCPDDGEFCTRDVCDGAGACLHDGTPLNSCLVAPKGKLQILNDGDDTKDKLSLQMQNAPGVTPADFGDPTSTDTYHACIFGPTSLLMQAEVGPGGSCNGKPCWAETTTGFTYKDSAGTRDGITALTLKASAKPKTKITAKARGANLDDPVLPFPEAVMAQIVNAQTGQCFETYFLEQTAVKKNDAGGYDAKAAAPGFEIPGLSEVIRQDDLSAGSPAILDPEPRGPAPGPDPTKVYVESITYEGTGCPEGTVSQSLNAARTQFTLIFDQMAATKGAAIPADQNSKRCQVNLDLKIPQGWQYSVATLDYRGFVQLPKKMKATHETTYYFEGDGAFSTVDTTFVGPTSKDYLIRDTLPYSTVVWSSCDKVRPLTLTTEISLRGGTENGQISVDSLDGRNVSVLGLRWQQCP